MNRKEKIRNISFRMNTGLFQACETAVSICTDKNEAKELIKQAIKIQFGLPHIAKVQYEKSIEIIDNQL